MSLLIFISIILPKKQLTREMAGLQFSSQDDKLFTIFSSQDDKLNFFTGKEVCKYCTYRIEGLTQEQVWNHTTEWHSFEPEVKSRMRAMDARMQPNGIYFISHFSFPIPGLMRIIIAQFHLIFNISH